MRNVKFISVFAACGFILSFVFGLFSHSSFIFIFLKALLFSALFIGLGFLIIFVFNKFLSDPNLIDSTGDFEDLSSKSSTESSKVGQHIDIVVEDEELPEGESDNHFVVGDNHQMLKNTDIKEDHSKITADSTEEESSFVPLRKVETSQNFSSKESASPESVDSVSNSDVSEDDIDTLPDMETMIVSQDDDSDESSSDSFINSGFGSSANTIKKSDGSVQDIQDAGVMAKAISTLLAEEDT